MSTTEQPNVSSSSAQAEEYAEDLKTRTEHYTRQEPLKAISYAFAGGLILTMLPVGSVIAGIIRLGLALVRPALVVLGAVKVYEEVSRRQDS